MSPFLTDPSACPCACDCQCDSLALQYAPGRSLAEDGRSTVAHRACRDALVPEAVDLVAACKLQAPGHRTGGDDHGLHVTAAAGQAKGRVREGQQCGAALVEAGRRCSACSRAAVEKCCTRMRLGVWFPSCIVCLHAVCGGLWPGPARRNWLAGAATATHLGGDNLVRGVHLERPLAQVNLVNGLGKDLSAKARRLLAHGVCQL